MRPLQLKQRLEGKILQPTGQSYAQKGVSEPYFLTILQMYFGEITQFGGEFPIPGSKYRYSQDIILIDPASGLHFDIEIDEPYEGKSKQPHHCIDEAQDRQRNQFFLAGNWIIVRFAEEQVVKYPHACCGYLTDVIATLTGINYHHKKLKKQNLPLVKCWTRNDARRMAAWSHREQYLEQTGIFRQTKKRKPK
ncbi:hypothetical protein C7H19_20030 [Aphanothece hegewaldii CCALA 016]|uniref:DUF559 domain-containing protein n=1 Tax=Aphanothece hegewaldii CCALA 016 TaxID=2107694 RepID=A0A2T1LT50_9CHRO|nr:hypothetical protein C7H19_20030 [Aphanothece hegewaldii CCALA 016]